MKKIFIGHRGVGKTSLLKRHAGYFPEIQPFDLDFEVEKFSGITVSEYFQKFGEADFREIERVVFKKLTDNNTNYVISLGAGFDLSALPHDAEVIFVSRLTDKDGRIFLNRPRLDKNLSPLEEYQKIFKDRDDNYANFACKVYHMPEGIEAEAVTENTIEHKITSEDFAVQDAYYTLCQQDLRSVESILKCYKKIELRTDLLNSEKIQYLLNSYPEHNWLISIRTPGPFNFKNAKMIDADCQFYDERCQILSSHADHIDEGIKQLQPVKEGLPLDLHLKLCPLVEKFSDLRKGHLWQQSDPQKRSFLPRSANSANGKWLWYRQLSKYRQKINFIRSFTQIYDQPSLSEWLVLPKAQPRLWAAVLGLPIHFSRSAIAHQNYFSARDTFFTRIEMSAEEFKEHIKFLLDLGLGYVAVTSPLKEVAFEIANSKSETAHQLRAVNVLYVKNNVKNNLKNNDITAHNTDFAGFADLVKGIASEAKIAVWGGGGTLAMMKKVLPEAHLYSSQSGQARDKSIKPEHCYDYLIWAAPRATHTQWPQDNMHFSALIDLNYTENSMGLEFAARRKISYVSGINMFKLQAVKQQEFWGLNEFSK